VRGEKLDVKELQLVDEDGLEQWKPVLKAGLPVAASDVQATLGALAVDAKLERDEYTLERLLDEVVEPRPELLAVDVRKRRRHVTVGGAMAERSELSTDRGALQTIAVESEDPALVTAAVAELELDLRRNVCVPRGLKRLYGLGRFAVVDVGTNSVKFVIGERSANGEWRTVVERAEVTRLGEGLDGSGELGAEPIARTVEAIAAMADEAASEEVVATAAVGTAGLRIARNSDAFVEAVRERTGIEVEIISGDEEARLAYVAVTAEMELGDGSLVLFDTGGGSSQFTFGRGSEVEERFSVDVGAVRFTERFGLDRAVSPERLDEARAAIAADLSQLDGRPQPDALVGIGGAVTNLAAVKLALAEYDAELVRGSVLDRAEIDRQIERYRTADAEERRGITGLQPGRAEVILASALIVRTILERLGADWFRISDRGLRHGLLAEKF